MRKKPQQLIRLLPQLSKLDMMIKVRVHLYYGDLLLKLALQV